MPKRWILMLALALIATLVSSCGSDETNLPTYIDPTPVQSPSQTPEATPTGTPAPEPIPTPTPTPTPEPKFGVGFIIPDSSVRPVAVMIDNQGDRVLPQGGISQAQIVYEILTEYNITRYMALFWNTMPEMIGPVRSSRHYFLDFAMEYDAIYTHYGGSDYAYADIPKLRINNIDGMVHGRAFWDITNDPNNWQDSFTSGERITSEIARLKYATKPVKAFPFKYNEDLVIPSGGQTAVDIFIKFANSGSSTCGYLYDKNKMLYKRIRMGEPQIERNTNDFVWVGNIIVLEMASERISNDKYLRINLHDVGTGEGWYITGGKAVKIKWAKSKRDAQTVYTTESGDPITLNRAQTWIEIVPNLSLVKIE